MNEENLIMHAGPPEWKMCGPLRGAIIGALIYEGLAKDEEEAKKLAASGEIEFDPNHHHQSVGPMAGVISASMPVYIVHNRTYDNYSYTNVNEGLGKCLRFGAMMNRLSRGWEDREYPLSYIRSHRTFRGH